MTTPTQPIIQPTWHQHFMSLAYLIAWKSKDPSTKVGAVIVTREHSILSTGYNGLPRGCRDDLPERNERPIKYAWYEHAERNAIYNSAMVGGSSLLGTTMYTPGLPCVDCMRGIIQSGIALVITHKEWREETYQLITPDQSWFQVQKEVVNIMQKETFVNHSELSINLPTAIGFFNGHYIYFGGKKK